LLGGAGQDTLTGGADIFKFSDLTHSVSSVRDRISDFASSIDDIIDLIAPGFSGITARYVRVEVFNPGKGTEARELQIFGTPAGL
jgi:Ca2+-binding RTX toxin-like protein